MSFKLFEQNDFCKLKQQLDRMKILTSNRISCDSQNCYLNWIKQAERSTTTKNALVLYLQTIDVQMVFPIHCDW